MGANRTYLQKGNLKMSTMMEINGNALKNELLKRKVRLSVLSIELGYASHYLENCVLRNRIRSHIFRMICEKYDFDSKTINAISDSQNEIASVDENEIGLSVQIDGDKLRLVFSKNGNELHRATSIIKGDDDFAIAKAVSSAAFMIYKFAEQKKMEE